MHKRGISPLIATIILVGFVIALASILWIFFFGKVTEWAEKQEMQCGPETIASMSYSAESCTYDDKGHVYVNVSNMAQSKIDGFIMRIFPTTGDAIAIPISRSDLDAGETKTIGARYPNPLDSFEVEKIQLIPITVSIGEDNLPRPQICSGIEGTDLFKEITCSLSS